METTIYFRHQKESGEDEVDGGGDVSKRMAVASVKSGEMRLYVF